MILVASFVIRIYDLERREALLTMDIAQFIPAMSDRCDDPQERMQ
jgi:hypothetical protein